MESGCSVDVVLFPQELEVLLDDERRSADDLRGQLAVSERKRITAQQELEDVRSMLEAVSCILCY